MKQCPKCGKMLNDSMAFCTQCGTPLANAAAQPAPQPPQQPVWSASQPTQSAPRFAQQPTQQHYYAPANPVLNTIKQMATSPLFLAATAAQSGMVLFNIIASMAGTSGLLGTVGTYLSMILSLGGYSSREASGLLDGIGSLFTGASLGATLVGQCPAILIAVGLWLIYLAEAGKISTATKSTGFTVGIEFFEPNINTYYTTVVWHRLRVIFYIKNHEIFTGGCTHYCCVVNCTNLHRLMNFYPTDFW